MIHPTRRDFLIHSASLTAGLLSSSSLLSSAKAQPLKNPMPRWKGFNLLDFFSPDPARARAGTTEEHLQWMADWGFDFIRLPIAYPAYVRFDRGRAITIPEVRAIDSQATDRIEQLVYLAHKHGLHVSLNLHRAPGFCVNAGFERAVQSVAGCPGDGRFCVPLVILGQTFCSNIFQKNKLRPAERTLHSRRHERSAFPTRTDSGRTLPKNGAGSLPCHPGA